MFNQLCSSLFVQERPILTVVSFVRQEIALLENTRRNATIVCAEPTEFIVIDKEDYVKNGLSDQMKEETRLRFEFFRWVNDVCMYLYVCVCVRACVLAYLPACVSE